MKFYCFFSRKLCPPRTRHLFHPLLLHYHAEHGAAQPQRQDEDHRGHVREAEQGHQLRQGPARRHARGHLQVRILHS